MTKANKDIPLYKKLTETLFNEKKDKLDFSKEEISKKIKDKFKDISDYHLNNQLKIYFLLLTNYIIDNYDPEIFKADRILDIFNNYYENIASREVQLSKFKRNLLNKTEVEGYKNGHDYNVITRKNNIPQEDPKIKELSKLKLDSKSFKDNKKKQQESLSKKLEKDLIIYNHVKFTKTILKLFNICIICSNKINDCSCSDTKKRDELILHALLFSSGRRINEILNPNTEFKKVKGERKKVLFKGNSKGYDNNEFYEIPLLVESYKFINLFNIFNKRNKEVVEEFKKNNNISNLSETEVITKANYKFTDSAFNNLYLWDSKKKIPKEINDFTKILNYYKINNIHNLKKENRENLLKLKPHMYRSIYAELIFKSMKNTVSKNNLFKKILLHNSNYTNVHYSNVILK
jgi:hypothetical protein